MAKSFSLGVGNINLTAGAGTAGGLESVDPETPFRILVLGDFSGQGRPANQPSLAQRKPIRVDRDNLDAVLAKLAPAVKMSMGPNPQEQLTIAFREMEDFEPDRLFPRLSVFESLGDLRRRLHNPAKFADAAEEMKGWAKLPPKLRSEGEAPVASAQPPVSTENLLDQILGETEQSSRSSGAGGLAEIFRPSEWDRFLKTIVEPHLVARTDPRLPDFEAALDEAISAQMRTILHHADFQALEAAWRGLFFLVRRLETDEKLQLYIMDVTQAELAGDLLNVEDLVGTGTYRHLVERTVGTAGGQPWAAIVGLYTFGPNQPDLELLANLSRICGAAGAPFLSGAHSLLLGCPALAESTEPREWQEDPALAEAWGQLRRLPEATFLGLALPRFLLRLPYGKNAHSTEQFAFEEMPPASPHESYLWGNPALAAALLLGQSFSQWGWSMRPGQLLEIDGLPVHIYQEEDEPQPKPCAEVLLNNRTAERILDTGLMPLLSIQGRDAVRLGRFQSLASPAAPLAGRWQ